MNITRFSIYSFFFFKQKKRSISEIRIKKKRLEFKADIADFYWEKVTIFFSNVVTFGFYSLLGYGPERWARFIDSHIKVY